MSLWSPSTRTPTSFQWLAKEWSMSDDGLSYTFVLNEGITFHDGEPFNAEAVIANWERGRSDQSLRIYTQTQSWG